MRRLVLVMLLGLMVLTMSAGAPIVSVGAQPIPTYSRVTYVPPSDGHVVDPFRPPAHIGAPGNRGLEYGGFFLMAVFAAAEGQVEFAGGVGGRGVITIRHADGLKTTYSGLSDTFVANGAPVRSRQTIGIAQNGFHFGAVLGDHYLDPQVLLDASSGESLRPRLIPVAGPGGTREGPR
ncbi:MAG: M23 family metallopeptidase [Actinomycetota bacterium]